MLYPGYIASEMNEGVAGRRFMVSTEKGVRAMVDAIEKEKASAVRPAPAVAPDVGRDEVRAAPGLQDSCS